MTAQHIDTTNVTAAQLDACTRIADLNAKQVFYLVRNSRDLVNDAGEVIEYKVAYDRNFHILRCQPFNGPWCPAAAEGTVCWHLRAAHKAAENFKAAYLAKVAETERTLREIEADDRAMWLETSSSLDGQCWEIGPCSGTNVPMR